MKSGDLGDLLAFMQVARAGSFTRAAAQLGLTQSSLSQTIRGLEARLGYRLLNRTTRSLSTTEAGQRLLLTIAPRFEEIEAELSAIGELSGRPTGHVRITCSEHAAEVALWPKLRVGLRAYPDIKVEVFIDPGFTDIAAQRFDAGVRLGESVEKNMIAVCIGPDQRLLAVASPDYFKEHGRPLAPQDLVSHRCINLRLTTQGGLYPWEFEKDGHALRVRVDGQLTFNTIRPLVDAALAGYGIAFVPEDSANGLIQTGALEQVLDTWCQPFAGFHLYYPSRRQNSPAFQLVVDMLRHRK